MTEMEVLTNKTYRIYDEQNNKYRFNVEVVRELLGDLYTNALQDEVMQRIKKFYKHDDVIERILLQEHFPKLARQVNKEFPFHYTASIRWSKHMRYVEDAPMRNMTWEGLSDEDKEDYKKRWVEDSSLCYSNMYLQMLKNNPPTPQQIEDDMLGLMRYLEYTSHTIDELFEPQFVYNNSRLPMSDGARNMDQFTDDLGGMRALREENPF